MNNCGCKRPAFGPEPHAPVPLHGGGFVPNAIEWLKKKIDKLFGTVVFTVNGHKPEGGNVDVIVPSKVSELENDAGYLTEHQDVSGIASTAEEALSVATDAAENSVRIINGKAPTNGNVKIVLDDLADKDGNIETTKTIMVSRDGGESHAAVALYPDLINEIDAHNNDEAAHPKLMSTVAEVFATKTEVDAKADKTALQAEVQRAQAAEAQLTTKANELDTAKLDANATAANSTKLGGVEAGDYALKTDVPSRLKNDTDTVRCDGEGNVYEAEFIEGGYYIGKTPGWPVDGLVFSYESYDTNTGIYRYHVKGESEFQTLEYNRTNGIVRYKNTGGSFYGEPGKNPLTGDPLPDCTISGREFTFHSQASEFPKEPTDRFARESDVAKEVERAQKAEEQLTTKVENAQTAANAAQSSANMAQSSADAAQNAADVASDKADAVYEALANKLDKTAVVAPSASATAGQAADAKAVNDALAMKASSNITTASDDKIRIVYGDNVWWIVPLGIYYWNDGEAGEHAHSPTAVFALPTSVYSSSLALTSDIEDAVKNKVGSFESVGGASATIANGVAKLSDFFTESNSLLTGLIASKTSGKADKDDLDALAAKVDNANAALEEVV